MASYETWAEYLRRADRNEVQSEQDKEELRQFVAGRLAEMTSYLVKSHVKPLPIFESIGYAEWQTRTVKTGWFKREKQNFRIFDHKPLPNDGWLVTPYSMDETPYANILTVTGSVLNVRRPGIILSAKEEYPKISVVPAIVCDGVQEEDFFLPGMLNSSEPGSFSDGVRILARTGDQPTLLQRPEWRQYNFY